MGWFLQRQTWVKICLCLPQRGLATHCSQGTLERADPLNDKDRLNAEGWREGTLSLVVKRTRKVKALTVALTGSRERKKSAKDANKCDITRVPAQPPLAAWSE